MAIKPSKNTPIAPKLLALGTQDYFRLGQLVKLMQDWQQFSPFHKRGIPGSRIISFGQTLQFSCVTDHLPRVFPQGIHFGNEQAIVQFIIARARQLESALPDGIFEEQFEPIEGRALQMPHSLFQILLMGRRFGNQ